MIRFDRTNETVLVHCACGWRQLARSIEGADQAAHDHIYVAHPAPDDEAHRRFLAASRQRRRRAGQ